MAADFRRAERTGPAWPWITCHPRPQEAQRRQRRVCQQQTTATTRARTGHLELKRDQGCHGRPIGLWSGVFSGCRITPSEELGASSLTVPDSLARLATIHHHGATTTPPLVHCRRGMPRRRPSCARGAYDARTTTIQVWLVSRVGGTRRGDQRVPGSRIHREFQYISILVRRVRTRNSESSVSVATRAP